MHELFCPVHGIPAFIAWVILGVNPQIIQLTFLNWYDKVTSALGKLS